MSTETTEAPISSPVSQMVAPDIEVKNRIVTAFPHLAGGIEDFSGAVNATNATVVEKLNAMLILEKVIADDLIDIANFTSSIVLAVISVGLRSKELISGERVKVIGTEEQLASDVAVAVFATRYCFRQSDSIPPNRKFLRDVKVKRGSEERSILAFSNSYLDALLREELDSHDRIGGYLIERGIEPESEKAVIEIREYLEQAKKDNPALVGAWL